ncbi:MAG: hypothetical protein DMF15_10395 [Verrucomicrobia bacterium]|nr:MAG: hypothetical protein DMF15_10395 [Verrucomicrobiota bacterium]
MLSRENINVLFTSAGRRVELLRAFREAYSLLGIIGYVIALDADPLALALQIADKPFIAPCLHSAN